MISRQRIENTMIVYLFMRSFLFLFHFLVLLTQGLKIYKNIEILLSFHDHVVKIKSELEFVFMNCSFVGVSVLHTSCSPQNNCRFLFQTKDLLCFYTYLIHSNQRITPFTEEKALCLTIKAFSITKHCCICSFWHLYISMTVLPLMSQLFIVKQQP